MRDRMEHKKMSGSSEPQGEIPGGSGVSGEAPAVEQDKPREPVNKSDTRGDGEEWEELRNRIFELKTGGMSWEKIAVLVGKSKTTVRYHYKQARLANLRSIEAEGWKPKAGEIARKFERLQEVAWLHLQHLTVQKDEPPVLDPKTGKVLTKGKKGGLGSVPAAIWTQTYMKLLKEEYTFLMDLGVMPRAKEKLEITFQDARSLSLEELQTEAIRLSKQLTQAQIVPDAERSMSGAIHPVANTFNPPKALGMVVEAKVVKAVDKAVDEISKIVKREGGD